MVKQLLQEAEQETWPASQERKYLRLVAGKVIYVSEAEVMKEEVLAGPRKILSEEDILVAEWNCRIEWAEQLKERISLVHQMMRDDEQRPSQYEPAYNSLWNQYRDAIESLRELDSEAIDQFRDKVLARLKELEARINSLNDLNDPDYFDYYEKMLAVCEKTHDQAVVLGWQPPQPQLPEAKHPCYKTDSRRRRPRIAAFQSVSMSLIPAHGGQEQKVDKMEYLSKREFNARFLWELQRYTPKVAQDLLRECRRDIRFKGWWYAQRRWAKFIGLDKEVGACPVCGSNNWWQGSDGGRVCGRCHPKPGEKVERSPVDSSYFTIEEGERILAVWRREGKPAIPLSQGARCLDLERFLAWPTNSEHVKAVKDWVAKHQPVTLRGE